jgi:hypothetical protein
MQRMQMNYLMCITDGAESVTQESAGVEAVGELPTVNYQLSTVFPTLHRQDEIGLH